MIDIKKEIGKKIKVARLNNGQTQADICDDESELTIRQLARIENGQAMPTVPKLMILSKKLGISIQSIVDLEKIEIPKIAKNTTPKPALKTKAATIISITTKGTH